MTEKRMKILHVLTDRNIGGAGRWLLYYLKYHNREKFAVKVVLPHDSLLVAAVQALDVHMEPGDRICSVTLLILTSCR